MSEERCHRCNHPWTDHRGRRCTHTWLGLHERKWCDCTEESPVERAQARRDAASWNAYLGRKVTPDDDA